MAKNHILFANSCCAAKDWIQKYEPLGCYGAPILPNAEGQITVELLEAAISIRTSLLVMPWVDPFTGVVHPIWEIGDFL